MLRPRAVQVAPLPDYKLRLVFETGECKVFDVAPYIHGDWFGNLAAQEIFQTVHLANNTVEWAGGQDIAPHELYDDSLPCSEPEQGLVFELIKRLMPDDVATPGDLARHHMAVAEYLCDETVLDADINWN
ncbi:hypothetical protein FACS1894184_17080 [Clostridia bacterium]|nr:hypothetical protein FACS1894184_17080 [Clostridia bacterium]